MRYGSFILMLFLFNCAPALDEPQTVSSTNLSVDYPSNWYASSSGPDITIEERLLLGQYNSDTRVVVSENKETHEIIADVHQQKRKIQTEIAGELREGTLQFSWDDDEFVDEQYCFKIDVFDTCVRVMSSKRDIERARPGIDLVLKSIRRFESTN